MMRWHLTELYLPYDVLRVSVQRRDLPLDRQACGSVPSGDDAKPAHRKPQFQIPHVCRPTTTE